MTFALFGVSSLFPIYRFQKYHIIDSYNTWQNSIFFENLASYIQIQFAFKLTIPLNILNVILNIFQSSSTNYQGYYCLTAALVFGTSVPASPHRKQRPMSFFGEIKVFRVIFAGPGSTTLKYYIFRLVISIVRNVDYDCHGTGVS